MGGGIVINRRYFVVSPVAVNRNREEERNQTREVPRSH